MLQGQLDRLGKFSVKCLERTNKLTVKFEQWADMANTIVKASTAKDGMCTYTAMLNVSRLTKTRRE